MVLIPKGWLLNNSSVERNRRSVLEDNKFIEQTKFKIAIMQLAIKNIEAKKPACYYKPKGSKQWISVMYPKWNFEHLDYKEFI